MKNTSILITERIRVIINEFLGAELIPECAIGNELCYVDGALTLKTFQNGTLHGYRKLDPNGELINIITEYT